MAVWIIIGAAAAIVVVAIIWYNFVSVGLSGDEDVVVAAIMVALFGGGATIGILFLVGAFKDPNITHTQTHALQSLVQQAGGKGDGAYVRMDYTDDADLVITYAVDGKLIRADGDYTIIKTGDTSKATTYEYFSHHPWLVPQWSSAAFHDKTVITVPKDKIIYGHTDQAFEYDG